MTNHCFFYAYVPENVSEAEISSQIFSFLNKPALENFVKFTTFFDCAIHNHVAPWTKF